MSLQNNRKLLGLITIDLENRRTIDKGGFRKKKSVMPVFHSESNVVVEVRT